METTESEKDGDYKFSCQIAAHTSDVKCVVTNHFGQIITGSRDESIKAFSQSNGNFYESLSLGSEDRLAVNAVAFHSFAKDGWLIFAGRKDGSIAVYKSSDTKPVRVLHEHKMNVCVLYVDNENGKLLSGSWDGNAIVWPIQEIANGSDFQAYCLVGHSMSVWAVVSVPGQPDFYLTGSADLSIKYWKEDKEIKSLKGHEDVVRSLIVLSEHKFLSAGNDFTIRLWDLHAGVCLQKYSSLSGEYIYSLAYSNIAGCNLVASSGEGGFLELWDLHNDGSLTHRQLIRTPAQSLWSVAFQENADIAVAANDGYVYIFTTDAKRKATAIAMSLFQCGVERKIAETEAALAAQRSEIVKIKVALDDGQPTIELKYKKGSDPYEAAKNFLIENNLPASYLNEVAEYIIENIPEAREAVNKVRLQPAQKTVIDGKEWDYVFDVTTEDGKVLKLPYNAGEDPNWASQRFVEKHNLPVKFLDKVSKFLRTQISEASSSGTFGNFSDPFTENRYIPGTSFNSQLSNGSVSVPDPFTGGNAYVSRIDTVVPNAGLPIDKKRPRSELVPLSCYFQFGIEQASAKAIIKLRELNEEQSQDKLNEEQLNALEDILKSSTYEARDIHVSAIDKGFQWPIDSIVPIMDVFRLAVLNETLNRIFCSLDGDNQKVRGIETMQRLTNFLISANSDPVRILACRALANAAVHHWGRSMLIQNVSTTVTVVSAQLRSFKPALQLAAATALANWSLILLRHTESGEVAELGPREDALQAIIEAIKNVSSFGDHNQTALLRLLQAIVTLMWGDIAVIRSAKTRNIIAIVNRIKDAIVDENGKAVARDIIEMAYSS